MSLRLNHLLANHFDGLSLAEPIQIQVFFESES